MRDSSRGRGKKRKAEEKGKEGKGRKGKREGGKRKEEGKGRRRYKINYVCNRTEIGK